MDTEECTHNDAVPTHPLLVLVCSLASDLEISAFFFFFFFPVSAFTGIETQKLEFDFAFAADFFF